ncbi:hypothetical protein JA1_003168 [Spathaspora sp. JA1]|nr:hypothetical protein JA1_003168 [Spathaspora sp. JA1]
MSSSSSSDQNPLLVDPSIVSISDQPMPVTTSSIHNLEPGNALSKLLDSAMAHAAKESTPDISASSEVASSATAMSATTSSSIDPESIEFYSTIPEKKQGLDKIYTVDFLLSLRDAPEIAKFKPQLPDKSFWKMTKAREPATTTNRHSNKKSNSYKRQQHSNETWERGKVTDVGFFKSTELDSMSQEKISQLLGESNDDLRDPEWEDTTTHRSNGRDDLGLMGMGQTVEDFERWKSKMKLEQRRRNGEVIDESLELETTESEAAAAAAGNEVDNFFSFVKPKDEEEDVHEESHEDQKNKSSRFLSFFPQQQASAPAPEPQAQPVGPPPGMSKFFRGPPTQQQPPPQQPQQQQQQPQPAQPQQLPQQPPQSLPFPPKGNTNDSFFMALLNRKEPGQETSEQQQSPQQQQQHSPQQQQPSPSSQQDQKLSPEQLRFQQRIPPWMRQQQQQQQQQGFSGAPPNFPPGQGPNRSGPPGPPPGMYPFPPPGHPGHHPPPPPGMFPNGFPPPGVGGVPPPNFVPPPPGSQMQPPPPGQYGNRFLPPQFMARGMPLPPHLQQQQQQQQQQNQQQQPR